MCYHEKTLQISIVFVVIQWHTVFLVSALLCNNFPDLLPLSCICNWVDSNYWAWIRRINYIGNVGLELWLPIFPSCALQFYGRIKKVEVLKINTNNESWVNNRMYKNRYVILNVWCNCHYKNMTAFTDWLLPIFLQFLFYTFCDTSVKRKQWMVVRW